MSNIYDAFTYIGRQCPECNFVSTEEKPIREEIEEDTDNNTEKIVLVCGQCNFGFYKD
jgi:uncharacterized protein with PIN domain